jgi:dynein heavy chain
VNNISTLLVPTVDTVRYAYVIERVITKNFNVLLTGPTGTGKTVIVRKMLNALDPISYMSILTMLSG